MEIKNSAFVQFGLMPEVCIHSPIEDQYSKFYIPRETCGCGCSEWIEEGCTMILGHLPDGTSLIKEVHRCKKCLEVRVADHISVHEKQG